MLLLQKLFSIISLRFLSFTNEEKKLIRCKFVIEVEKVIEEVFIEEVFLMFTQEFFLLKPTLFQTI